MRVKYPILSALVLAGMLLLAFQLALTLGGPRSVAAAAGPGATLPLIHDFEAGIPAGFVGFSDAWDGSGSSTTLEFAPVAIDRPAVPGGSPNSAVAITYTIALTGSWGGGPGYGGVTYDYPAPADWTGYEGFSFWLNGSNSGGNHRVELKSSGAGPGSSNRYEYTFADDFSGWKYFNIPIDDFTRRFDFNPGPSPDDPINLAEMWGYSILLDPGSGGTMVLDQVALTRVVPIHDFEAGIPAGFVGFSDAWDGSGSSTLLEFAPVAIDLPLVPSPGVNQAVAITYSIALTGSWGGGPGYGGVTFDYPAPADWTGNDTFRFWLNGSNSGGDHRIELKSSGAGPGSSNRYEYTFSDDFSGWTLFELPIEDFTRRFDFNPGPSPDDPINPAEMWGYSILLAPGAAGTMVLDEVALAGPPLPELTVAFANSDYAVDEGGTATITVTLSMTSTDPVTVTYATSDGSATAGEDYTAASGQLLFTPGMTETTFTVATTDDAENESNETVALDLSDAQGAALAGGASATLTILDNDEVSAGKAVIVDDFENGLPTGVDGNGIGIGFVTWDDGSSTVAITTTTSPPAPVPDVAGPNTVLEWQSNIVSWGGFSHAFENGTVTEWVSQDWSGFEGFSFWLYGTGSGTDLFVDIIENRNPGSTSDDAERWTVTIPDDTVGWQYYSIPWADFGRKDIGNGAPNDGFTREEVHGYAFGSLNSDDVLETRYIDQVGLLQRITIIDDYESGLPSGLDPNGIGIGFVTFADGGSTVSITTTMSPPAPVPDVPEPNTVLDWQAQVVSFAGFSHAFENETVTEWVPQDWSSYEGFCFWLYGTGSGTDLFVDIIENRNPGSTSDDAERWSVTIPDDNAGWQFYAIPWSEFSRKDIGNGAPNDGFTLEEVHGYAFGALNSDGVNETRYIDQVAIYGNTGSEPQPLRVEFALTNTPVVEGGSAAVSVMLNMTSTEAVTVSYASDESSAEAGRDYLAVAGTLVFAPGETEQSFTVETIDDGKHEGDELVMLELSDAIGAEMGFRNRTLVTIEDNDAPNPALLDDFEGFHRFETSGNIALSITEIPTGAPLAIPGQGLWEQVLTIDTTAPAAAGGPPSMTRTFVTPQDWSAQEGLTFWFYGQNSGLPATVTVLDNQSATTGDLTPAEWVLTWSDEFNEPAGTPPNANNWKHEIGDGTLNGIPGWGNSELEYYTDSPDNAAMDGAGNLVITVEEIDGAAEGLACWYGPCEYTSARLISADRQEFEYGRIESRIKVPFGDGLWPAFWTLGTDIDEVGWPQTGEIDIMEYVGREPTEVFGTIHGPGYSGGASYGGVYDFGFPVQDDFHVFAIEWGPGEIRWYVDDILFHTATPADVAPNEWVFDHPFFLLLNVAVGGNFGGPVGPGTTFPQTMEVDYVRVYGAADTAERFEATFLDNFSGWQQVTVPFAAMSRSATQPPGAPDDGFGLTEVWGYGMTLPTIAGVTGNGSNLYHLDQVSLAATAPTAIGLGGASGTPAGDMSLPAALLALVAAGMLLLHRRRRLQLR